MPSLRKVSNDTIIDTTREMFDSRVMTVNDILENDVKFSSMVVRYKVYQSSRYNSIFGTTIYFIYKMLKEDKRYDLCTGLINELLSNLKKIKQEKNTLLSMVHSLFLALYFLQEILDINGNVQWAYDRLVAMQVKEGLWGVGDATMKISTLWGYFKTFQSIMKNKERILKEVVEKYEKTIFFMVDKDTCLMEALEPWIV